MTNSSPQNPPPSSDEQRIRLQTRNRVRQETMDEWIAIIVAFGTIGAILFWSLGFREHSFLSTRWNKIFARSGDILENDQNIDREVFTTADNLETTDTQLRTFEEETFALSPPSFFSDALYSAESSADNQGLKNSLIVAVPLIGATRPEITRPETTPPETTPPETTPPEITRPEITRPETTPPETEPEATAPETTAPETTPPETEPEATAPETTAPETTPPKTEPEATTPETTPPETETVVSFTDVTDTHWAYPFIQELGEQQLVAATSDNNFEPDDLITRAGMATLISQAFDRQQTIDSKDFQDIDDGNVIAEDIDKAVGIGFMKGYSDDEFRPAVNITRYQVLVALATGLGLEPSGDPLFILRDFSDRDRIPKWAISQVAAATEAGLVVNRPDFDLQSLNPQEPATRAEVAAMIYQTLEQMDRVEGIDSSYIVPNP
ncbi:putative S-layer protein [Hyella patelloides LEGE 07179]|uniref:Putative S-layer protein n=1 Tax=Hyella patelloides LEGE 07179 TaxID=945734 RepID=A0A563VZA2_9CYAN|nr:S-layer homology domain-containing protein [Hyella patelloides]VEP16749.1 putative S-layer protein [Hyella patelloides LEGE 07179]